MNNTESCRRKTSGIPIIPYVAVWLLSLMLLAGAPGAASAAEVTGDSRTYVQFREAGGGDNLLPLYEYLNLSVQDPVDKSITIHMGGWLRYDLRDDSYGSNKNNDLQYAYLSIRRKESNSVLNLGRMMVFEGVAAERIDGGYGRTDLAGGFRVSAFGGVPVELGGDTPGKNVLYGGRIAHQMDGLYTIGASYVNEEKEGQAFREERGLDLWLRPMNKVELMGRSSYNARTDGWMEHAYYLVLGPFHNLRLNTQASRINYEDYFIAVTNPAFSIQPGGLIDPKENVSTLGEEVSYDIGNSLNVTAVYKKYTYEIAGDADRYGGKVSFAPSASSRLGFGLHRMVGESAKLKYNEYRLYGYRKEGKADLTVELFTVKYEVPINGTDHAHAVSLAAGYELNNTLKLGADVEFASSPDFDQEVRALLKLQYRFAFNTQGGV